MDLAAASMLVSCETLSEVELNTTYHLHLTIDLDCCQVCSKGQEEPFVGIDWDNARQSGALLDYVEEVRERMAALQSGDYDDALQVDAEIRAVARLLTRPWRITFTCILLLN